ncbi:hypothetical protein BM1374166_01414 [Bartonella tribocorum]|nr:hypothetical protein BM1374166_01414 [Bartonella tribocorum]
MPWCKDAVLSCSKHKDVGAQWILQYIIYGRYHETGVTSVERCFFSNQCVDMQHKGVLFFDVIGGCFY